MRSLLRAPRFLLAALLGLVATSAIPVAAADLQLAWNDNTADEDGFELERQETDSGNYIGIARLAANTTAFTDAGLPPETTYCYRIRAFNTAGESLYSQSACAKTTITVANSNGRADSAGVNRRTEISIDPIVIAAGLSSHDSQSAVILMPGR